MLSPSWSIHDEPSPGVHYRLATHYMVRETVDCNFVAGPTVAWRNPALMLAPNATALRAQAWVEWSWRNHVHIGGHAEAPDLACATFRSRPIGAFTLRLPFSPSTPKISPWPDDSGAMSCGYMVVARASTAGWSFVAAVARCRRFPSCWAVCLYSHSRFRAFIHWDR